MSKYIPIDKMKQLREAAKNGDARAKKILKAQLNGSDFSSDLDSYFATPVVEETKPVPEVIQKDNDGVDSGLEQFLKDNGVSKGDIEYDDFVEDYYNENPQARPKKEIQEQSVEEQPVQEEPKSEVEPVQEVVEEQPVQETENVEEEVDLTKDIAQQLINVINSCDKAMVLVLNNDKIEDTTLKGAMTTLQEIKNDILNDFDKIKKVKKALCEKKEPLDNEENI